MGDVLVHKLTFDDSDSRAMVSQHIEWAGMDDTELRAGKSLAGYWNNGARFVMENELECDLLWVIGVRPVFSNRLKRLMETHGITNVEFYPMNVEHVDGRPMGKYWYVNVLKIEGGTGYGCVSVQEGLHRGGEPGGRSF